MLRFDQLPPEVCADAGYGSEENYCLMEENAIDAYVKYSYFHTIIIYFLMVVWNSHDFMIMDFGDFAKIMLRFIKKKKTPLRTTRSGRTTFTIIPRESIWFAPWPTDGFYRRENIDQ
jgi:hypothetical protein